MHDLLNIVFILHKYSVVKDKDVFILLYFRFKGVQNIDIYCFPNNFLSNIFFVININIKNS